ncbi:UDP-N-acetylmuramate dehydrogenase [bacterium]|nr:UDP-N-acetylmuramate dehydrogenase [bacterium]
MIRTEQKHELRQRLSEFMTEEEPLAPKTAFKTGGAAAIYLQPADLTELLLAVKTLAELKLGFLILGGGRNLLIADDGIRNKVVISLSRGFMDYEIVGSDKHSVMIRAEAGVSLAALVNLSGVGGYGGLENLAGMPGSLGGAIAMNAGAFGSTIFDHLAALWVLHDGGLCWRSPASLNPGYRDGGLGGQDIVVAAYLILPRKPVQEIVAKVNEIRSQRWRRLPQGAHAGSVFKNPDGNFAGRLLESAGCKGLRCGGAKVAVEHANVIVAEDTATSQDIIDLMESMQASVRQHCGTILQPEIRVFS